MSTQLSRLFLLGWMGKLRLLVETALREVVLQLHREGVASQTIAKVSGRLAALQRDIVDCESYDASKNVDPYEARAAAKSVMQDILDQLYNKEIPNLAHSYIESELRSVKAELSEAIKERDSAMQRIEHVRLLERRHADAHMYALHCYFREVFQLRQVISDVSAVSPTHAASQRDTAALLATSPSGVFSPAARDPSVVRLDKAASFFRRPKHESFRHVVIHAPGGATLDAAPPTGINDSTPLLSSSDGFGAEASGVFTTSPRRGEQTAAVYPIDAIFDYEKYLDLQRSDELAWEAKYHKLNDDFNAFIAQVERDKAHAEAVHLAAVKSHQARYNALLKRLEDELKKQQTVKLFVGSLTRQSKQDHAKLKDDIVSFKTGALGMVKQLQAHLGSLGDYSTVLVDFVRSACKYMSDQSAVVGSSTSKVEEIARFQFQRSLVPAPGDSTNAREAKLYWRRHELSNIIFSTVMELRQMHEERVECQATIRHQKDQIQQLQEENLQLLETKASFGFVGLHDVLRAAAASLGSIDTALSTTSKPTITERLPAGEAPRSDLPLAVASSDAAGPKGTTFVAVPMSTAWILRNPTAVLPLLPPLTNIDDLGAAGCVTPVDYRKTTSLRLKMMQDEVDGLVNDRLFFHRLCAVGRDPSFYLRDIDRDIILKGWRRHMRLVHQRNVSIFQKILVCKLHQNLVDYFRALFHDATAAALRAAPSTAFSPESDLRVNGSFDMPPIGGGVDGVTREAVLDLRESLQHLGEVEVAAALHHAELRQVYASSIAGNIRWVYSSLERHVIEQLRGIFPSAVTLRANAVPPIRGGSDKSVSPTNAAGRSASIAGGKSRRDTTRLSVVSTSDGPDWKQRTAVVSVGVQTIGERQPASASRRPLYSASNPANLHLDGGTASALPHGSFRYLMQAPLQFSTTKDDDDEASSFFRVESLVPPRCIAIPTTTTGGVGSSQLNHMSIRLLTKAALMTTSQKLKHELEAAAELLPLGASSPRPASSSQRLVLQNDGSASQIGSAQRTSASAQVARRPPSGQFVRHSARTATPAVGGSESPRNRHGSASGRLPPPSTPRPPSSKVARVTGAVAARIGVLPPPVYAPDDA